MLRDFRRLITHVGEHHKQFGRNIVLQFSNTPSARPFMRNTGNLFAFYSHLSVISVSQGAAGPRRRQHRADRSDRQRECVGAALALRDS
jgi:hypothetical protein